MWKNFYLVLKVIVIKEIKVIFINISIEKMFIIFIINIMIFLV